MTVIIDAIVEFMSRIFGGSPDHEKSGYSAGECFAILVIFTAADLMLAEAIDWWHPPLISIFL
jgi:hypothetical protein